MISEVDGNFDEYTATITATEEDFSDAVFEFAAQTSSFNTANTMRDGHLKDERYFDVEQYPEMTFKSTSFTRVMGNDWKMTGNLTIKGKTLPVVLDVTLVGPQMNERAQTLEIGIKANYKTVFWTFPEMIERASGNNVSQVPGDIIGSGTVGWGSLIENNFSVHRPIEPGDVVELEIEGIGVLKNTVI